MCIRDRNGTEYNVKIEYGEDKFHKFHAKPEVHGVSTCLNVALYKQCNAEGYCKDIRIEGPASACLIMEIDKYIPIINAKIETKSVEDICKEFENFIKSKSNHKPEYSIQKEFGEKNCYLHYSKEELNRIFSQ